MRYYTTEYRDGLTSSIGNLVSSLDESYTSDINAVSETSDSLTNGLKENALSAANHASDGVQGIIDKLNAVSQQLTTFYQGVDEIGQKMDDEGDIVVEILNTTNGVIDNLCDLLNGVGTYEGQVVSPALIDSVCEPLDEIQEPMQQFMDSYYLDEDGLVDQAAVERTYDLIGNEYDPETGEYSDYGETMIDMYSAFVVEYTSREDLTDEQMESLLNANLAAGMVPDTTSPSPDSVTIEVDGTDYYVVNFPYVASDTMKAINERIYELNYERYRETRDENDHSDDIYNTATYLDIMSTFALDHVSVSSLIPVSDVDPEDIDLEIPFHANFDAPTFPNIISYTTNTDENGDPYGSVVFDLPVENPYYQVVFFSTDEIYLQNQYDEDLSPRTGFYPSGLPPFTFCYPCDGFDVYSNRDGLLDPVSDEEFEKLNDLLGDDWQAYLTVSDVYDKATIIQAIIAWGIDTGLIETSSTILAGIGSTAVSGVLIPVALIKLVVDDIIENYHENVQMDFDEYRQLRDEAAALYDCGDGGHVVLHNEDSAVDSYDLGAFYFYAYH